MCIHVAKGKEEGAMEKERGKGCMQMDKACESPSACGGLADASTGPIPCQRPMTSIFWYIF
jgi:hypothetical protein